MRLRARRCDGHAAGTPLTGRGHALPVESRSADRVSLSMASAYPTAVNAWGGGGKRAGVGGGAEVWVMVVVVGVGWGGVCVCGRYS